jgi:hypothetical protein
LCSNLHALRGCHTALCLRWDGARLRVCVLCYWVHS